MAIYDPRHAGDEMPAASWFQPTTLGRHRKPKVNLIDRMLIALTGEAVDFEQIKFP